jgi:hypothetical protein
MKSLTLNRPEYTDSLTKSLVFYLDDGFYASSVINTSGYLVKISHPEFTNGQVWGSKKKNWDWLYPPNITANPSALGNTVNFRDGLIVFNSPQSSVYCEYKYRPITIIDALENDFFRGEGGSLNVYDGSYRENAIQLPLIAIEYAGVRKSVPYGLGGYAKVITDEFLLNVFAPTKDLCERLCDILFEQSEQDFQVFDYKQANSQGYLPLNDDGYLNNVSGTYNYLCSQFPVSGLFNSNASIMETIIEKVKPLTKGLFHSTVRFKIDTTRKMGV